MFPGKLWPFSAVLSESSDKASRHRYLLPHRPPVNHRDTCRIADFEREDLDARQISWSPRGGAKFPPRAIAIASVTARACHELLRQGVAKPS